METDDSPKSPIWKSMNRWRRLTLGLEGPMSGESVIQRRLYLSDPKRPEIAEIWPEFEDSTVFR